MSLYELRSFSVGVIELKIALIKLADSEWAQKSLNELKWA